MKKINYDIDMPFVSIHENYNFKNINKHYNQKNVMTNYLYEHCADNDIFTFLSHQEWYNDYIYKQNTLYEGLITTYPINDTINALKKNGYGIYTKSLVKNNLFNIYVKCDNFSFENLNNRMKKYGYYYVNTSYYVDDFGKAILCYVFSPKYPIECTEEVYSGDMYLYHLTNDYYIDKILKNGLSPKSHKKMEKEHPNRIYLGIRKMGIDSKFTKQMYSKMRNHLNHPIEKLYVLKIDLSKCEDKRFYYDHFTPAGIFTHENIPPQCISIIEEIDVNDL